MKKYLFLTLLIFLSGKIFANQKQVIVKFKNSVSNEVINSFKSGSPFSGNNQINNICRNLNVTSSSQLFKNHLNQLSNFDNFSRFNFENIFILNLNETDVSRLTELLSSLDDVEYASVNNSFRLNNASFIPNDTYFNQQYYLNKISIPQVWDINRGDSNIVIGVIDSGLDFLHPDLQTSYKINRGETGLDALGRDKRFNGIDDDNNGFIDDWRGWDFVDAPFTGDPRRGDYLNPDNDPTDDNKFSHGTAVTGIINATFNNSLGISSVAPGCRTMILRCFDAEGFGEEDDVANAILYGIANGVKIFNFSFGDYVFSNLLKDVIKFAYLNNVTIIASAGNDGSFRLHYPSSYDEVISVAASDETDFKASFSSYGETVDIYAPGFQILTTTISGKGSSNFQNNYDKYNGTSFAAPQIAALCGILLSLNPSLTNEELRGLLIANTDFMPGQNAWTALYASGRVNALRTVQNINNSSIVRIYNPFQDYTAVFGSVPVFISAASPLFVSYSLFYGYGQRPSDWIPLISNVQSQVLNDSVYNWNLNSLPDSSYTLRLAINTNTGRTLEHRMIIFKDSLAPVITDVAFGSLIDKDAYSELIIFNTDKRSLGKLFYKPVNSTDYRFMIADLGTPNLGFVTPTHFALLGGNDLSTNQNYEFYLEATGLNNKKSVLSYKEFRFTSKPKINIYGFNNLNFTIPYSQYCNKVTDINNNGKPDIFINEIKNNLKLNVYEFDNGVFNKISSNNWGDFKVARDVEDIDGDGKSELLTSRSRNGILYKSENSFLPDKILWADTIENNFWSARFADSDNDGKNEILGFGVNGLRILEFNSGNFNQIANLNYGGAFDPVANSQNVLVEDFDTDGKKELVFINTFYLNSSSALPDLYLNIYENISDNNYQRIFADSMSRFLKGDNIVTGDFDGDGIKEFAIGTVSKDGEPVQYYRLIVYKSSSNNTFDIMDIVDIYNYKSYTETSTLSANIDADIKDEILVNTGTHFYILKYNNSEKQFTPELYKSNINSFNQLIYNFNNNAVNEILVNNVNDSAIFFEKNVNSNAPPTPMITRSYGINNTAFLSYTSSVMADYFKIYRSLNDTIYTFIDSTSQLFYVDSTALNNTNYFYKISSVSNSFQISESPLTNSEFVFVHPQIKLSGIEYKGNGFVGLKFSGKISNTIPSPQSFVIRFSDTTIQQIFSPNSIAVFNDTEYLLKFDSLKNNSYSARIKNLNDFYNAPIDESPILNFIVNDSTVNEFYISNATLLSSKKIKIIFNLPVSNDFSNINFYKLTPFNIPVLSVELSEQNNSVILNLGNGTIGATGKNYVLKVSGLKSSSGITITTGAGSTFGFVFNKEDLEEIYTYPNPVNINSHNMMTFANLTVKAKIQIFDITGKFIKSIDETDGNGGVEWDLKDNNGNIIPSGIYLYKVSGVNSAGIEVKEKLSKFAVIK